MKKDKNVNYYRNLLQKDAISILKILIISIICEIFFQASSNYDYLILIILYLVLIFSNKNSQKKSLGIIMIIASILIIIESIVDFSSLFNLIFTLLGSFSIYHSICYLKKIK